MFHVERREYGSCRGGSEGAGGGGGNELDEGVLSNAHDEGPCHFVTHHPRGGLIEEDELGVPNECNCDRQLALHTAGQVRGQRVDFLDEADITNHGAHGRVHLIDGDTLNASEKVEMLLHSEVRPKHVVLRAVVEGVECGKGQDAGSFEKARGIFMGETYHTPMVLRSSASCVLSERPFAQASP